MGIGPSTKETSLHHFRDPLLDVVSSDEDLAGLAVSTKGGKKNVLPEMDFYIVLNKADDEKRLKMAERIALRVERDSGEKVRITSFR